MKNKCKKSILLLCLLFPMIAYAVKNKTNKEKDSIEFFDESKEISLLSDFTKQISEMNTFCNLFSKRDFTKEDTLEAFKILTNKFEYFNKNKKYLKISKKVSPFLVYFKFLFSKICSYLFVYESKNDLLRLEKTFFSYQEIIKYETSWLMELDTIESSYKINFENSENEKTRDQFIEFKATKFQILASFYQLVLSDSRYVFDPIFFQKTIKELKELKFFFITQIKRLQAILLEIQQEPSLRWQFLNKKTEELIALSEKQKKMLSYLDDMRANQEKMKKWNSYQINKNFLERLDTMNSLHMNARSIEKAIENQKILISKKLPDHPKIAETELIHFNQSLTQIYIYFEKKPQGFLKKEINKDILHYLTKSFEILERNKNSLHFVDKVMDIKTIQEFLGATHRYILKLIEEDQIRKQWLLFLDSFESILEKIIFNNSNFNFKNTDLRIEKVERNPLFLIAVTKSLKNFLQKVEGDSKQWNYLVLQWEIETENSLQADTSESKFSSLSEEIEINPLITFQETLEEKFSDFSSVPFFKYKIPTLSLALDTEEPLEISEEPPFIPPPVVTPKKSQGKLLTPHPLQGTPLPVTLKGLQHIYSEMQHNTWNLRREEVIHLFTRLGCDVRSSKGSHVFIRFKNQLIQVLESEETSLPFHITLPQTRWKNQVPLYLRKSIWNGVQTILNQCASL